MEASSRLLAVSSGRHNEPLGIHSDVQLPPIPAFLRCLVLLRVLFAAPQNLEPCGINDQVDRAVVGSGQGRHRKTSGRCWARMSPRPPSPRYWTSPAPPSTRGHLTKRKKSYAKAD